MIILEVLSSLRYPVVLLDALEEISDARGIVQEPPPGVFTLEFVINVLLACPVAMVESPGTKSSVILRHDRGEILDGSPESMLFILPSFLPPRYRLAPE